MKQKPHYRLIQVHQGEVNELKICQLKTIQNIVMIITYLLLTLLVLICQILIVK